MIIELHLANWITTKENRLMINTDLIQKVFNLEDAQGDLFCQIMMHNNERFTVEETYDEVKDLLIGKTYEFLELK